jgi:ribosomal-protein-alanine N-acetyltransferase
LLECLALEFFHYNDLVLKLRHYGPEDFEHLVEIDHACFAEGIAYPEEEMRYFVNMRSAITLVGMEGKTLKGFVIADHFRPRRGAEFMGRIITIDVAPQAQKSGLGRLLLKGAEEELIKAGCGYVSLEVSVDNPVALHFYKKMGYSVLQVLPRYYLGTVDGLLMGKKLKVIEPGVKMRR